MSWWYIIVQHMKRLNKWGVDMFTIAEASGNRPLTVLAYTIFAVRPTCCTLFCLFQKSSNLCSKFFRFSSGLTIMVQLHCNEYTSIKCLLYYRYTIGVFHMLHTHQLTQSDTNKSCALARVANSCWWYSGRFFWIFADSGRLQISSLQRCLQKEMFFLISYFLVFSLIWRSSTSR